MRKILCDRHPDREAVATFKIREVSAGSRPILLGPEIVGWVIDLCEECAELVRPLTKSQEKHSI